MAVVANTDPFMIIGRDVLGGDGSKLRTLSYNTDYCVITVLDEVTQEVGNIHYVSNIEMIGLPVTQKHATVESSEESVGKVAQLFRR